jgi:hypothetical protein
VKVRRAELDSHISGADRYHLLYALDVIQNNKHDVDRSEVQKLSAKLMSVKPKSKKRQWRSEFEVGYQLDALDQAMNWYEASIVQIKDKNVLIHYNGW